jgi:threonine aldolase
VKLQAPIAHICQHFDTVSICLSKGLAAPVGSVLVGDTDTIRRARRWRKMLGGGMRQAGVIAAAGLYALKNNVERLADDHDHAEQVAAALVEAGIPLAEPVQTNMLFVAPDFDVRPLIHHLESRGVRINGHRWVFHQDVSEDDTAQVIEACRSYRHDTG